MSSLSLIYLKKFAIACVALFFFLLFILHFLEPSITPDKHFLSDFALGGFGYVFNIALISLSVGKMILVFILSRQAQQTLLLRCIEGIITLSAVANFLIVVFPTEYGANISIIGQLHIICAILAFTFTGIFLALLSFWNPDTQSPQKLFADVWLKRIIAIVYLAVLIYYPFMDSVSKPVGERALTILLTIGIILNLALINQGE